MKPFLVFVTIFALIASQSSAQSCLTLNGTSYGNGSLGTNFTDYNFLAANENPSFVYRLKTIQLCLNSSGVLTGMRAIVGKVLSGSNITTSDTALNRIGSVNETGVTCTNFTLDAKSYISSLTVSYSRSVIT
jgi:hypothetical protein